MLVLQRDHGLCKSYQVRTFKRPRGEELGPLEKVAMPKLLTQQLLGMVGMLYSESRIASKYSTRALKPALANKSSAPVRSPADSLLECDRGRCPTIDNSWHAVAGINTRTWKMLSAITISLKDGTAEESVRPALSAIYSKVHILRWSRGIRGCPARRSIPLQARPGRDTAGFPSSGTS